MILKWISFSNLKIINRSGFSVKKQITTNFIFFEIVQSVFYRFAASKMSYEPIRMVSLRIENTFLDNVFLIDP